MSLKEDLYSLWKTAESLEVHERFRAIEAESAIRQRDELLALCQEKDIPLPDAFCRHCDAPMSMKPWSKQYCQHCTC